MKTTIELPDELFARAKAVAAERRVTLKAMIEHALTRELLDKARTTDECQWELNDLGFPVLSTTGIPFSPCNIEVDRNQI